MNKEKLKSLEVFYFVDYDYDDVTAIYITDCARACYGIAEELDKLRNYEPEEAEKEFPELVKELGKVCFRRLANMVGDEYFEAFAYLCKKRGILLIESCETEYRY